MQSPAEFKEQFPHPCQQLFYDFTFYVLTEDSTVLGTNKEMIEYLSLYWIPQLPATLLLQLPPPLCLLTIFLNGVCPVYAGEVAAHEFEDVIGCFKPASVIYFNFAATMVAVASHKFIPAFEKLVAAFDGN
jgi:hypothetical protein